MGRIEKIKTIFYSKPAIVLIPYIEHWEKWAQSHLCFLRAEEKGIVNAWLSLRNPKRMAEEFGLSETKICSSLQTAVSILEHRNKDFYKWLELEEEGANKEIGHLEQFLYADFAYHAISLKLYYNFNKTICNNIKELLEKYTLEDLRMIRGFGKISVDEFKNLLIANECQHLLRRKNKETRIGK